MTSIKKTTLTLNKALFMSILFLVCFLLIFNLQCHKIFIYAATANKYYARIVASNVNLYRSTTGGEDYFNVYFTLPQSYFVEISPCDHDDFYVAKYLDTTGYIKRNEVQCVKGTPTVPFADNIGFRVFIPGGVELRSSPNQGLNSEGTIQYLETNLKYYGTINGEEAISYKSTEWYFCKYTKNGETKYGYIYSAFCDMLTSVPSNTEVLEYIDEPMFETVPTSANPDDSNLLSSLPSVTQIIIIVAVCLPCIFIIYLLFRPTRITARVMEEADLKTSKKSKKQKIRHHDYYEYDENL
jgi:hypothetical protein